MSKTSRWKILGDQNVFEKGGSLATVIPNKAVKHLQLASGSRLIFLLDSSTDDIVVVTEDQIRLQIRDGPASFGAGVSRKEVLEIIEKSKKPDVGIE
jgi:antitoxin component of MazEF toxin-antitoxin module